MPEIGRFEELPLEDLVIDRFQARTSNVGEGLEELAASIEKWGLLHPVIVCKSERDPEKWEIIAGQRRYLAHKQILKRDRILAGVIDERISIEQGLALSASENVLRIDMTRKDLIDLCVKLHKRYGTFKDVAEETKLPYEFVRKFIRYDGLPVDLQKLVDEKRINVDLAMRIQDAATASGAYDAAEAESLLGVLTKLDDPIQRKVLDLRKKHPTVDLERIVEKAEEPDRSLKLKLVVGESLATPLRRFAVDEDMDEKGAVLNFIEDSLTRHGYLNSES